MGQRRWPRVRSARPTVTPLHLSKGGQLSCQFLTTSARVAVTAFNGVMVLFLGSDKLGHAHRGMLLREVMSLGASITGKRWCTGAHAHSRRMFMSAAVRHLV